MLVGLQRMRRGSAVFLALVLFAAVLSPVQVAAQSQNEVLINVLYDGTSFDTDPLDDGSGNGVHTPGLDGGENNNVVKTYDTFAVRIDWNVNEDAATGVFLEVALPPFASWAPDATGQFSGCDPATSSFADDQTLVCSLLDQQEGSNGTIRALATLDQPLDGTEFNVSATLATDDDPTGVVDQLDQPLVASEAPIANWLKGEPEISGPVSSSSGDGYVFLYPLSLLDFSQGATPTLGSGPISGDPIDFFDHAFQLVASATIADADQMTAAGFGARSSCGAYDGAGAFPITPGTWTCGAETSPNGYPVVPINVVGHDASAAPATNADGTPNVVGTAVNVLTGQIAFWLPADEVDAEIASPANDSAVSAQFENGIAQDDASVAISSQDDVSPILVPGTSGYVPEASTVTPDGDDPANNTVVASLGVTTSGGSPGSTIGHNVVFHQGPLQILESNRYGTENPRHNIDLRPASQGGLFVLPGSTLWHGSAQTGDLIGETPRGATLTIQSQVLTASTAPTSLFDAPIHGCTAFDTSHYYLSAFGDIPVSVTEPFANANTPAIVGGYSTPSNTGPLAHVYTGSAQSMWNASRGQFNAVGGGKAGLSYTVEFTDAPIVTVGTAFGVEDDQLTCRDSDAGSSGWVDATTGDLSVFDTATPGDGVYEGITRARVRITEHFPWAPGEEDNSNFTGFQAFFQASVKTDLAVQTVDQELFVAQSHSYGDLGPDGVPDLRQFPGQPAAQVPADCQPYVVAQWEANGNNDETDTGWCNNSFIDDGVDSFDDDDLVDWDTTSQQRNVTVQSTGDVRFLNASGSVVSIVEAALRISKTNNDGLGDIKDNGQLVEFTLAPSVVGSSLEALTNVRVSDNLPPNYHFVRFVTLPTTPGSSCAPPSTPDGTINCQFSEPNPAVDTSPLPAGLAGGWSDEVVIEVEVVGAIANPDSPTVITNTASAASTGLGPWDPATEAFVGDIQTATKNASNSANSFLPLPADEGAIIKTVDTLLGACDTHPLVDPAPAGWADRCSEIGYNDDLSFVLSLTNEGNTEFTNIEIVDVFPHNADGVEPASNTPNQGGSLPNTIGDGREPASDFAGTLGFLSVDPVANAAGLFTWVTGDPSATISRDPAVTVGAGANTWCDAVGGAVQVGSGTCPTNPEDVTATYSVIPGALAPNDTLEIRLNLDSEGVECDDHWTNTFGARVDQILLPIRSNDVTVMVQCEYDLALEKTIDPAFVPGADWITPGVTTIDFLMEVINQGDPVEDFHVTDYVDTSVFTFDPANNTVAATTAAGTVLPFVWDTTDPAAPVAQVDGALAPGESVFIPVTLTVENASGPLNNFAEISYFDSDGDPSNGDSDPANPNNPSSGHLADEDSFPDDDVANDPQPAGPGAPGDGAVDGDGTGSDPVNGDEDDQDIAGIPVYDLELIKTAASPAVDFTAVPPTATYELTVNNQGNADVFLVDVTDYGAPGLTYDAAATAVILPAGITDANPTFTIDTIPAGGSVTIPVVYQITDLSEAPYTNAAEISAFDSDADPDNAPDPFAVDLDSTPDDVNDDDVINHNESNYDPDGDGNVNGPTPGDEDDHDIETIDPFATAEPGVDIEKDTNGVQSDEAPGEEIVAGSAVTWTYVVTNTGGTGLADATVTDSQGVIVACDVDGDGVLDGTNVIPFLAVGATVTCEGTGTATPGPYQNNSTVSGAPVVPDFLACGCDPTDPTTWPTNAADYVALVGNDGLPVAPVTDEDASHYTGTILEGGIDIEKATNGVDSDEAPGELLAAGDAITWTYVVTNTGATALADATVTDNQGVIVDCDVDGDGVLDGTNIIAFLAHGASVTCEGTGVAVDGPYENIGDVSGAPIVPDFAICGCDPLDPATWPTDAADYVAAVSADGEPQAPVADADASHYTGLVPGAAIDIEKATNGVDSDEAPGEVINVGEAVTWTYVVVNTGSLALTDATVTDNQGVIVDCDVDGDGVLDGTNIIALMAPGASVTCEGTGVAVDGPYENIADVSGAPAIPDFATCGCDPEDPATWPTDAADFDAALDESGQPLGPVTDADASHYTGFTPVYDLALEKTLAAGQSTDLAIGDDVTFTIEIFNQGNVDATGVEVIDYIPAGLELNDSDWVAQGSGSATTTIPGVIAAGTSASVDVTMTITAAGDLSNNAEITGSTAIDANGEPFVDPAGVPLQDVDSVSDTLNTDVLSDGVVNGDGGDEDDHDVASISIAEPPVATPPTLAFTGRSSLVTAGAALVLLLAGVFVISVIGRKEDEELVS